MTFKEHVKNPIAAYPIAKGIPAENAFRALREAKRARDTHFNRVWKYYYEPKREVLLSDFEEELRKRWNNVWLLLTSKVLNDRKAVLAHITWCKDNYMDIAERTAYDDVRRAKMLFGDPKVSTHMFEKARISAVLMEQIERMREIQETGNTIDKIEAAKAINSLTRRYNAVNGLEGDIKTNIPRAPIVINFNADPETLKLQAAELVKDITLDTDYSDAE